MAEPGRRIAGRMAFEAALPTLLQHAVDAGSDVLRLQDSDFLAWPLGTPATVQAFETWMASGRQLRLLCADATRWPHHHPRWWRWHGAWSHRIACREARAEDAAALVPLAAAQGAAAWLMRDSTRWQGAWLDPVHEQRRVESQFDALFERASPAAAFTTLGL